MPPHVKPSSKLYSILKPAIEGGGVTVNAPQPGLTIGAVGAAGNITTLTIFDKHVLTVPDAVVPQVAVKTYRA